MKNTKVFAEVLEDSALKQFEDAMKLDCNVQGALMPDAHTGYSLPIGAVIKTKDKVFPSYVGYDIGCGVACVELGIRYTEVNLEELKKYIINHIPLGFSKHEKPQNISSFLFKGTSDILRNIFTSRGAYQLGTLGGGNHFIEVGYRKQNKNLCIVIHSGSRGLGHGVASHYMEIAAQKVLEKKWKEAGKFTKANRKEGSFSLDLDSDDGRMYMRDQTFCLEFALLNRKKMIDTIVHGLQLQGLAFKEVQFINRNHNHAEYKNGYIIHRKGATHAEKDMLGIIPGNMKDGSFIVKGKGNEESLCSSSHGAGRVLSRRKAKETLSNETFNNLMVGIVTNHTEDTIDESPEAYKNIFEVMELQKDLVEIVDRIIPILNIKG